jgi:hypothetical protein
MITYKEPEFRSKIRTVTEEIRVWLEYNLS